MSGKIYGYVGESPLGSVRQISNGELIIDSGTFEGEKMVRCRFCKRFIRECHDRTCDGCWEVTSRLADFVKTEGGITFVREVLERVTGKP